MASSGRNDLVSLTPGGQLLLPDGSLGSPTIGNIGDPDTGPWWSADNEYSIQAGGSSRARVRPGVTYMPGPLQIGTDLNQVTDPVHLFYMHKDVTGAWSETTNIVDALLVEINGATSSASDIGAVAGFVRAMTTGVKVSMRGIAGQLMVDLGAQTADREAGEFGVHTSKAVTSKADNRTVFDEMFGNVGLLISAYSGTMADGNTAQRANTAIGINTYSGSGGHWKQFIVAWDVANVKAFQVEDQGNVVAGGGGNNAAEPAYGFLDTLGDIDVGTGIFWGGNDVIGFSANTAEIARIISTGFHITGNLQFLGDTRRIYIGSTDGDVNKRTQFVDRGTNTNTFPATAPSGTAQSSGHLMFNRTDTNNAGFAQVSISNTSVDLAADKIGTGAYLPLRFLARGAEVARFDLGVNNSNVSGFMIGQTADLVAGTKFKVAGGIAELAGLQNLGVLISTLSIPTAIGGNTNDYVPSTGITFPVYQISASGAFNLTGLNLSQTKTGHMVTLINGGGNNISMTHADILSLAANRFNTHTGATHILTPGRAVTLIWTGAAWRFFSLT